MHLYLLRHCQSEGQPLAHNGSEEEAVRKWRKNFPDRHMPLSKKGQEECALTAMGLLRALKVRPPHGNRVFIVHSPYMHARQTAENVAAIVRRERPDLEVILISHESLRDIDHGDLWRYSHSERPGLPEPMQRGIQQYEAAKKDPAARYVTKPPGGESPYDMESRIRDYFIRDLRNGKFRGCDQAVGDEDSVVVVGHSFPHSAVMKLLIDETSTEEFINDFIPRNGSIRLLESNSLTGNFEDQGYVYEGPPQPKLTRDSMFTLIRTPALFTYAQRESLNLLKTKMEGVTMGEAAQRMLVRGGKLYIDNQPVDIDIDPVATKALASFFRRDLRIDIMERSNWVVKAGRNLTRTGISWLHREPRDGGKGRS